MSPPPNPYQLFSVEAKAKSLCVIGCLPVDCEGWEGNGLSLGSVCGGGRVHGGDSVGVFRSESVGLRCVRCGGYKCLYLSGLSVQDVSTWKGAVGTLVLRVECVQLEL